MERIACISSDLQIEDIQRVIRMGDRLVIDHCHYLSFWDMTDPLHLKPLHQLKTGHFHQDVKLYGHTLLVIAEEAVLQYDLSDVTNPQLLKTDPFPPKSKVKSGCLYQGRVYLTYQDGVAYIDENGKVHVVIEIVNNDRFFHSYPSDILIQDDIAYVVGRHAGLSIFRVTDPGTFLPLKTIQVGYTPTRLALEGHQLLLVGNEDFVVVDVKDPARAKRHKAAKLDKVELAEQFATYEDELFIAGDSLKTKEIIIGKIKLTDKGPLLSKKYKIKPDLEKYPYHDAMRGVVVQKGYVLLFSYYRQVAVYRLPADAA